MGTQSSTGNCLLGSSPVQDVTCKDLANTVLSPAWGSQYSFVTCRRARRVNQVENSTVNQVEGSRAYQVEGSTANQVESSKVNQVESCTENQVESSTANQVEGSTEN